MFFLLNITAVDVLAGCLANTTHTFTWAHTQQNENNYYHILLKKVHFTFILMRSTPQM